MPNPERIDKEFAKLIDNLKQNGGDFRDAFILVFSLLKGLPDVADSDKDRLERAIAVMRSKIAPRDPPGCPDPSEFTKAVG